VGKISG